MMGSWDGSGISWTICKQSAPHSRLRHQTLRTPTPHHSIFTDQTLFLTPIDWLVGVEFNAPLDTIEVISEAVFTANHLTDTDKQKQYRKMRTQYKSEKVNNLKYSKMKLPWFSCLLQHSARKRGGLILQRPRAHTGRKVSGSFGAPRDLTPNQQCQSTESTFKQLVYECPHDHQPADKAYLSDITAAKISKSSIHKMAVKTSRHRYGTQLHHCRPIYKS